MAAGATFARTIASRTTLAPSSAAERPFSAPPNDPMAVRQALQDDDVGAIQTCHLAGHSEVHSGSCTNLLDRRVRRNLQKPQTRRRHFDDRYFADDQVDDLQASETATCSASQSCGPPPFVVCSIAMITLLAPATRSIAPPMP